VLFRSGAFVLVSTNTRSGNLERSSYPMIFTPS